MQKKSQLTKNWRREVNSALEKYFHMLRKGTETNLFSRPLTLKGWSVVSLGKVFHLLTAFPVSDGMKGTWPLPSQWFVLNSPVSLYFVWLCLKWAFHNDLQISSLRRKVKIAVDFVNFVLFTKDRTLTNETQLNCFISLSYSLIYIRCVKSYSAKFVRNHSLIRYFLHFDWLLPSTDLKGSFKVALIM